MYDDLHPTGPEGLHRQLAAEFEQLAFEICHEDSRTQQARISKWFSSVPEGSAGFAYRLINIYKAREQTVINTGSLFVNNGVCHMADKSIKVDTGGGDVVGNAVGHGAQLTAQIIQSIKDNVDTSANIDADGRQLLKNAADDIGRQSWDEDVKTEVLQDLQKLGKEAAKETPNPSLIKRCWGAITSVAGAVPSVIEVGKWLAKKFPALFGSVPS